LATHSKPNIKIWEFLLFFPASLLVIETLHKNSFSNFKVVIKSLFGKKIANKRKADMQPMKNRPFIPFQNLATCLSTNTHHKSDKDKWNCGLPNCFDNPFVNFENTGTQGNIKTQNNQCKTIGKKYCANSSYSKDHHN
jgi:hypothetical protein